jgi:hypothetical protein
LFSAAADRGTVVPSTSTSDPVSCCDAVADADAVAAIADVTLAAVAADVDEWNPKVVSTT